MLGRLRYALDDSHADKDYGGEWVPVKLWWCSPLWFRHVSGWPMRAWCRWRGHPCGVIFYNVGGYEPDMRCINCGEDIG